jgi:hypothetical protein
MTTTSQKEGEQPKAVGMLEEAFRWMDKALRSLAMYTREHQVARSFETSTGQHLAAIPDQEGETWIEVRAKALLHGEREVYREDPEAEGFVFRMHRDGIRRLCLLPGLDLEEVGRLVQVFQADLDAPEHFDDDMVTLMWEAELDHVKTVVADLLTVLPDDADLRPCQDMMDRIIAAAMETRLEQGQTGGGGETIRMAKQAFGGLDPEEVAEVLTGVDGRGGPTPYEEAEEQLAALREQLDAPGALERFAEILYRGVALDPAHAENARTTFDLLVQALIKTQRYAELLRLIELTATLGESLAGTAGAAEKMLASLAHSGRVEALVDSLEAPETEAPVVLDILRRVPAEHLGDVVKAAARISDRDRRAQLTQVMAQLGAASPERFKPHLEAASPMEVRLALDALLAIGTEDALAALEPLRRHPSADMRITMLRLTQDLVSPALTQVRRAMLEDIYPRVRAEAERCLARLKDPELVKRLFRRLVDGTLRDQSPAEKRRVCAILGTAAGRHEHKLLQELVKRGRVLSGRRQQELCVAAAHGLAATGDRKHLELLEQTAEKRLMARQVRDACREAAEALRKGRKPMISVATPVAPSPPEPAAPSLDPAGAPVPRSLDPAAPASGVEPPDEDREVLPALDPSERDLDPRDDVDLPPLDLFGSEEQEPAGSEAELPYDSTLPALDDAELAFVPDVEPPHLLDIEDTPPPSSEACRDEKGSMSAPAGPAPEEPPSTPIRQDPVVDLGFMDLDGGSRTSSTALKVDDGYLQEPSPHADAPAPVDRPRSSAAQLDALLREYVKEPAPSAAEGGAAKDGDDVESGDAVDDLLKRYLDSAPQEQDAAAGAASGRGGGEGRRRRPRRAVEAPDRQDDKPPKEQDEPSDLESLLRSYVEDGE